jgi:hypothetical protein
MSATNTSARATQSDEEIEQFYRDYHAEHEPWSALVIDRRLIRAALSKWCQHAPHDAEKVEALIKAAEEIRASRPVNRRVCGWAEDSEGTWLTDCGEHFIVIEGTPSENGMRFCCYCGGDLAQSDFVDDEAAAREEESS